jgi:hypothetical protein
LIKVTRIAISNNVCGARTPRSIRGRTPPLSSDYAQQVISGVRFSPLVASPSMPTQIRSRVWEPALHKVYPESFRLSCKEILLCANAAAVQPLPEISRNQINVAAQLPRSIWMEILSFTHRDWFAQPHSEIEVLRRRLEQEQLAVQRAQAAQRDAEARLRTIESERDGFRAMALRCQTRLQVMMAERGGDVDNLLEDDEISESIVSSLRRDAMILRLGGMSAIMRQLRSDSDDLDDDEDEVAEDDEDIDDQIDATARVDDMESESDDDHSAMDEVPEYAETVEYGMIVAPSSSLGAESIMGRQARTVSISNDAV